MKLVRIDDYIHGQLKKEAKREGRTLQYLIESKLTKGGGTTISANPSENRVPSENISNNFSEDAPTKTTSMDDLKKSIEKPCCSNTTKPCQHWQWDSNVGYVNTLSGRVVEG